MLCLTAWYFPSFTLEFLLTNKLHYYFNHRLTNVDEEGHLYGVSGSSGGYAETIFRHAAKTLFGKEIKGPIDFKILRNSDFRELSLEVSAFQFLSSNLTTLNGRICSVSSSLCGATLSDLECFNLTDSWKIVSLVGKSCPSNIGLPSWTILSWRLPNWRVRLSHGHGLSSVEPHKHTQYTRVVCYPRVERIVVKYSCSSF